LATDAGRGSRDDCRFSGKAAGDAYVHFYLPQSFA
jgi:hypothetical protein